ncbi:YhgE/Pip domain-containing protein [Pseudalkalibacillus sp. SCS-8]|uniref:YhgE/Pip domain-containing protein n=1 Tax=Pseudalkalibacillus nanhaiensis TaxID=3115291 RepID=UPI0032DA21F6
MFTLLTRELSKLYTNKAILVSVIAALFVPVLYGGILLSATWGPYDNLENLPVAVVNNDQGAISGDESINVGDDFVTKLKDGNNLGWEFVNATDAMKGLEKNEYYMAIIIPEDFSQRVTTVMEPEPKKLELEYIQNEGLNFLASKITKTATEQIREKLANTITQNYTSKVFTSLDQVSEGFNKAADGSSRLSDGTAKLNDGTEKLSDGTEKLNAGTEQLLNSVTSKQSDITKLANGSQDLKDGTALLLEKLQNKSSDIGKLADGSEELHDGTVRLKDGTGQILAGLQKAEAGSEELKNGVANNLAPGARKVADGTVRLKDGAAKLAAGAEKLVAGLKEFRDANPSTQLPPYAESYQKIIDGAQDLSNGLGSLSTKSVALSDGAITVANGVENKVVPGTAELHQGMNKLLNGQQQVDDGATKLEDGAKRIADGNAKIEKGWNDLIDGVTKLDTGAGKIADGNSAVNEGWKNLSDGAERLNDGASKVNDGASKVNDGASKVNDGSEQLATGLKEGAEKTSGIQTDDENIGMFSSPVELKSETINGYEHYRDSTAPYILTLGLFVGILIMSMFIKFKRPANISSVKWFIIKFIKLASLAMIQALLLIGVVLFFLDLSVTNPFWLTLFALFVSVVFSAIVLFLASLGNIGRFLAIALVILQLSITGANLPIEMLPDEHRQLSEYLPFTYSIAGFRAVISLNQIGEALTNMGILTIYLLIFAGLSYGVFLIRKQRKIQSHDSEVPA